ncbi:DUF4304 domain-containing protein [Pseudorhodobacter sp.]|uniref:DUF4304 domain-containing protein n=1 Tax=Pseudorhodobacter sp. TaxID=1934400 RepID=UPI002AFDE4CD|nr:DUF4304 domain-containing protein [Pseudorhodobacter sp.]
MPFVTWLRQKLLPRQREAARKAPASKPANPGLAVQPADATHTPQKIDQPETVDMGVRMHIAAHDPQFSAKREAAVQTILAAIDRVAQAHGFTKKPKSWAKLGALGTVSIHLQRSRYGFDCQINLVFQPLPEALEGTWGQDEFIPLGRFYPPPSATAGTLTYLDIHQNPAALDQPMQVLNDLALPWLLAHLTNPQAPLLPCGHA